MLALKSVFPDLEHHQNAENLAALVTQKSLTQQTIGHQIFVYFHSKYGGRLAAAGRQFAAGRVEQDFT
jgi:hypothetical protein